MSRPDVGFVLKTNGEASRRTSRLDLGPYASSVREPREAPLEEPLLSPRLRQLKRARVGAACLVAASETPQEIGAGRVVIPVLVEVEMVEQLKACRRAVEFRDRHGAVHRDDRRAGDPLEPLVEQRDLRPVAWLPEMELGDRRLKEIWPAASKRERA